MLFKEQKHDEHSQPFGGDFQWFQQILTKRWSVKFRQIFNVIRLFVCENVLDGFKGVVYRIQILPTKAWSGHRNVTWTCYVINVDCNERFFFWDVHVVEWTHCIRKIKLCLNEFIFRENWDGQILHQSCSLYIYISTYFLTCYREEKYWFTEISLKISKNIRNDSRNVKPMVRTITDFFVKKLQSLTKRYLNIDQNEKI
jgi:hypothetical protein